jgi:tRNA-specific 2-thiouridylase
LKFARLVSTAREIGADRVATGHYARVEYDEAVERYILLKGIDHSKDQSYFLFEMTQKQLAHAIFPLGELTKAEVRELARRFGLGTAEKEESQEICFVPDGNYSAFVEKYARHELNRPAGDSDARAAGEITTPAGAIIGEHSGLHRYTVGQRRGIGISSPEPLYVVKIDVPRNQLVVGRREDLYQKVFVGKGVNWVAIAPPDGSVRAGVRIRYRAIEAPATIEPVGEGRVRVTFDEAQAAITPGQAAVFYDGDRVVGGAWIDSVSG